MAARGSGPWSPRILTAEAGGRFEASRRRPVGRIGGSTGPLPDAAREALSAALGPAATLLCGGPPGAVIADFDACWAGGERLRAAGDFAGRLGGSGLLEIDGAFALAWAAADGALCLARDPVGERCLFYARVGGEYLFASTVRALLATGLVPRVVDPVGVAEYLAYAYVPGERTLVEGIRAVLPGEILRLERGRAASGEGPRLSRTVYWSPPGESAMLPVSEEESLRRSLRDRIEAAVARRLPEGETVGASLSGGLDSSLVVALAQRACADPIRTFSISFGPGYPNELAFSSMVAEHCRTDHTILELPPEVVARHVDDVAACFDRPVGDPLTLPNALLFRHVTEHASVLLNGEGGDPCFGGPKNLPMVLAELYGDARNAGYTGECARERTYLRAHQRGYDDLPDILTAEAKERIRGEVIERELSPLFADERWNTFVNKLMRINLVLKGGHHILPKVDALSGAFGVRGRSPLLDRHVVEAAFMIPPQLKLRAAEEKYLLKRAVADVLPAPIIHRPKSGMGVPVGAWFDGPLRAQARERLLDGLPRFGIFERRFLEQLFAPGEMKQRRGPKIWLLLTLEAWLRRVLGEPAARAEGSGS